jgi:hypothetical protein
MNQPGAGDGMGEHGADRGRLDHRAEGIIIVDAGSLGEAMKDPSSLVPLQRAIGVELVYENPFTGDDIRPNRARDKIPGVISDQGSKFFFHVATPVRIDEGDMDGGAHR